MNRSVIPPTENRRPKFHWVGLAGVLLTTVLLTSASMLSGCSVSTKSQNAKLISSPVIDPRLSTEDFSFPSKGPSLKRGRQVFATECASCHSKAFFQQNKVKQNLNVTTPIDLYLMLSTGKAHPVVNPSPQRIQVLPTSHPMFKQGVSRDDRWAVLFYARYLAGAGDMPGPATAPSETISSVFGANCAVCHGTRGLADGPLHLGKTGSHEIHNAEIKENLVPPPARFHDDYSRMYNRTDAQIFRYVCEGIYPSAMPAWYNDVHRDAATGQVVYVFDHSLISRLVRHVRGFAYDNDLPQEDPERVTPPKGLGAMGVCRDVPTNRPWTPLMDKESKKHGSAAPAAKPAADVKASAIQKGAHS